jgi:hypothetical protein
LEGNYGNHWLIIHLIREQVSNLNTEDITEGNEGNKESGDGLIQEHKETDKEWKIEFKEEIMKLIAVKITTEVTAELIQ